MFMFMQLIIILSTLLLTSCTSHSTVVTQHGGMREALRMGKTESRITFEEVNSKPNAIAVGALTNLAGEITIFEGNVYTATTPDSLTATTIVHDPKYDSATLLSLAYVPDWNEVILPAGIPLEQAIHIAATNAGIDTSEPFPFVIKGTAKEFHLHVINGYCPVVNPELETRFKPWNHTETTDELITLVGFYAKNQEGVMTHHGSNVHMHGILTLDGVLTSGHIDSVTLSNDAVILLPAE